MAVAIPNDDLPPVQPSPVEIAKPSYRGTVVDTHYVPKSNILSYVTGSPWTVDYYSQVLGDDNGLSGQNPTQEPLYQPYWLVKNYVLRVTSPLSASQDPETSEHLVTGAANIYPNLIPNVGDVFVADIGDGRTGVFQITTSTQLSIHKDSVFAVEYELQDYLTDQRRGDLNAKTTKTTYFVNDFLTYGQNPLVEEEPYQVLRQLQLLKQQLIEQFFRSFSSREYKVLLVPGQPLPVYDHFVSRIIPQFFSLYDDPTVSLNRVLNASDDDCLQTWSLWEWVAKRDMNMQEFVFQRSGLVDVYTFDREPLHEGIYYSGLRYVVYPADATLSVDYLQHNRTKTLSSTVLVPVAGTTVPTDTYLDTGIPLIHPVLVDDYYVLSQLFYEKATTGQSLLELCLWDFLERKALDNNRVLALAKAASKWPPLERFYYLPLVLILVMGALRSF